ncbi:AEC family transporter [Microbulbifer sp. GL-2]|uniref:AEC family transporter n=1 Tax=Microbulbifer sp. GL-2 TaxID=2591606 RepID=UPI0011630B2F|nr:AEC family transporter [Microbulbifer sp. GL-2]BBM00579.1 transporter [Microbulbifer sp. GL-2]
MSQFQSLVEALVILVALCATAIFLRKHRVILTEEQGVFGRLTTDFALPAVILLSLSKVPFSSQALIPAVILFAVSIGIMVPAWLIGKAMGLNRKTLGSIVLVAGFGGSSTLGLSLIRRVFHNNPLVMRDSVLIGEYGALLSVFTFGVAVAIYFGRDENRRETLWEACSPFFTSPIFIAMVLGTAISFIGLPQGNVVIQLFEDVLRVSGQSLIVLVAFSIGLALRPIAVRELAGLIVVAVLLKLLAEPLLAWALAMSFELPHLERELLVLQAAMPSGAIAAVLAKRYGCDGAVASAMVVATAFISLISLPLTLYLGG